MSEIKNDVLGLNMIYKSATVFILNCKCAVSMESSADEASQTY